MKRLTDMEEMLHSICDEELKEFMFEAYLTYMAGAYKATIIVSTIAVFDDLRKKTKKLAQINLWFQKKARANCRLRQNGLS